MNRRDFLSRTAGVVSFGFVARQANASARMGFDAPPDGFPEFNWIDFPTAIHGIVPMRQDHLVSGSDGLYTVEGCEGPFAITGQYQQRLWARQIDSDRACVRLWHRF